MKTTLFSFLLFILSISSYAQNDSSGTTDTSTTYKLSMTTGSELFGKILKQDEREILLLTADNRKIVVPQHTIKTITTINQKNFNSKGEYIGEDKFATRYFLTTNGLPIKKGEHYVQWNLFGPDFQFAISKDLGVGIMSSWFGIPIIGTIKKSFQIKPNIHCAVGALAGTGSWAAPKWGGFLPFATLSFGDRQKNIAFSGGYGAIYENGIGEGRALTSVAGMIKISSKISLVFDSFFLLPGEKKTISHYDSATSQYVNETKRTSVVALLIPGVRWHQAEGRALQFGFTGLYAMDKLAPVPIPTIQWYRSL